MEQRMGRKIPFHLRDLFFPRNGFLSQPSSPLSCQLDRKDKRRRQEEETLADAKGEKREEDRCLRDLVAVNLMSKGSNGGRSCCQALVSG